MPLDIPKAPTKFPDPEYLTLENWRRGVITLLDKSRLPKNALEEADNLFLMEDGQPTVRPGVNWYGTATPNATGTDGYSMAFVAASSQYIDCGTAANVDTALTGASTISAWVKPTAACLTNAGVVVGKDDNVSPRGWIFGIFTTGKPYVSNWNGDTVQATTALTADVWQHIAITYSAPSAGNQTLKFYLNGVLDRTVSSSYATNVISTARLSIGRMNYSGFEGYYDGDIDGLRIYNSELALADITNDYNNTPTRTTLVSEYLMDEGTVDSTIITIDSYSESNYSTFSAMQPTTDYASISAQSFTNTNRSILTSAKFYVARFGAPPSSATAYLYAMTGTYGTTSKPTGAALATSDPVDVSALPNGYNLLEFTFSTPYVMEANTKYCIAVGYPTVASTYIKVGVDLTSPTHDGNFSTYHAGAWTANNAYDLLFYVYGQKPQTADTQDSNNGFIVNTTYSSSVPTVFVGSIAGAESVIDGFEYFDLAGAIHLVIAAGGVVYRSTDDGTTWDTCTGATPTVGTTVYMNQYNNYLYLTNGIDPIALYDGTTTLITYTTLTTPAAPAIATTPASPGTGYTYYYKISAVNTIGFSTASAKTSVVHGVPRASWDTATNFVTLTLPAYQASQTRFDIYFSEDDLTYYYLDSVSTPSVTYKDNGTAVLVPSTTAPTDNTTAGPLVEELSNVGSRMYGVRDSAHRYRIWFSSGNSPKGVFSSAYDGGYLDWQTGGKYIPQQVEDYRDGKGTPLATVWCKSADGQGCVLQMSLDTLTVADISVTIPSAYKLPGSRGTPAPSSVVNVLNDYMFYNSQAFYNLGSRAQFLNLLSTDEASANIRPTVKQISSDGEASITAVYFDAKVYFSVPYGSSTNNYTAIFDTERKAWMPKAFSLGFKKLLRYTDTDGARRLLAVKPGDNRLSEISTGIQGDYGVPFATSLKTGLYPTTKNRFEFQWSEEGEIEFTNPTGSINIELLGIERTAGFSTVNTEAVTSTLSNTGHDTFLHDTTLHDDTSNAVDTFSESSIKRYFRVQKELNAVQWHIYTNSLNAQYVLRTLQTWGTPTLAGKPRQWKIG